MADYLLLQDGYRLLLQNTVAGGRLLLQSSPPFDPRAVAGRGSALTRAAKAAVVPRSAKAAALSRSARGGYPVPVVAQCLDTIYQGEDISIPFAITTNPTGWATKFTLIPSSGSSVVVTGLGVSGSTPTWYLTAPLASATTTVLATGAARFQLHRTDTGSAELLASGTVIVADPYADIP